MAQGKQQEQRDNGRRLQRLEFHGVVTLDFDTVGFVTISSMLACVALITNSVPILIGAMILAPNFDPLIAIPFGVLNRDWALLKQGLVSTLGLFIIALLVCLGTVWVMAQMPVLTLTLAAARQDLITERLIIGGQSVITAFAAGVGGALAAASNRQVNLVGVVVTLALIPTLAAAAVGFNEPRLNGWSGLILFAINVAGILVSGYLTLALRRLVGQKQRERADAS